jgi:hypothetical protein
MNAVRRTALEYLERDEDDLTDQEIFAQSATDEYWIVDLALSKLNRLPSELDAILLCREYTLLQAYHLVQKAMATLARNFGQ